MAVAQLYTAAPGDTITAARWNNEFGNIYNSGVALVFPATNSVSLNANYLYLDTAGVTSVRSAANRGLILDPGVKSGIPGLAGKILEVIDQAFTDTNTAGSGTATAQAFNSFARPTQHSANTSVTVTDAATVYIANAPLAGTNTTLTNPWSLWVDDGGARFDGLVGGIGFPIVNEFRLSLTTALPVTTSDVSSAGTLYLVPYIGAHISLYSGSQWKTLQSSQVSLTLTLTSGKPYDVFVFNNSGTPALEVLVWTNDTTRATALVYQDGVLVKSGDATRRYVGSLYASGANVTDDSIAKRNLWNYYNRVTRFMRHAPETTDTWTYTTATWRQANANATNQLEAMVGVAEDIVSLKCVASATNGGVNIGHGIGIGLDSTSVDSSQLRGVDSASTGTMVGALIAFLDTTPTAGRHTFVWLERSVASGTTTWYGDNADVYAQSGITGVVRS